MVEFLRSIYYWSATGLVAILSLIFYPCRTFGRENVPRKGGFILASDHQSNIDPMLLPVVCPRQMRFMAKDSLFKGVLGFLIRLGGGFPVKRARADRTAIKTFLKEIKRGYPVLIFPQGTRGGAKVQAGVGFLATMSGVPVVPVHIQGTDKVLPKGAKFPTRTPVSVTFGKPFIVSRDIPHQQAAEQVMAQIYALEVSV